jgi:DtxR family transcriptional regulator, Mn-dependent transcriptional regulator
MQAKKTNLNERYMSTELSSNMEDYIETISMLADKNKVVRVKDIASRLDIKMPSVTAALNKLREMKLIDYEKYGFIELTGEGKLAADRICHRHYCLTDFFSEILKLKDSEAELVACSLEHDISSEACSRIHKFLEFYRSEKSGNREWIKKLDRVLERDE